MKKILFLAALAVSVSSQAQVTQRVQPEKPVNGKSYILVNKAQNANQYMSRTGWDGAVYFLDESSSNWEKYALTAFNNGDGTWSFGIPSAEEEGYYDYLAFPYGSPNLNVKATEPVMFKLDPKEGGFYNIILGDGNNSAALAAAHGEGSETPTKDLRMHLNRNGDFFVVNYYGGPYYGDMYGEIEETEDESRGMIIFEAKDSISFNWGFVSPENVPLYYADLKASGAINNLYRNYCNIEDYAEGFTKTYQACADLYNSKDYNEDDIDIITAMIDAKIALYKEIEIAFSINIDDNAPLNAAIASAKNVFDKASATAEVESATNSLKAAEKSYLEGSGDLTAYGQNMSFEDLSAQGGAETSNVAGAPTGWNIYINGNQVVTESEVKAAGFTAWHGVNSDSEGEIKDGRQSFGIWNGSIPTYEISQTIAGLENGSYEITAGLMAGSNGNGSRLTTQRIFGNLSSAYYGSEEDYNQDELDKSEIYSFAGNEIITTDREMRPVTVRAFVYDGTLTFGVRTDGNYRANWRDNGNGAGGDGWFKVDNFRIINKGYVPEDAVTIYLNFKSNLDELSGEKMAAAVEEKMEKANNNDITSDTPLQEIIDAILSTRSLVAEVSESVKAYEKLAQAIEKHYENLDLYQNKAGVGEYSDAVMEAEEIYNEGSAATTAEIDAIIANLDDALQKCIQSDEIVEGSDLTEYLQNPSFEDLSNQNNVSSNGVEKYPKGWNLYVEGEATERVAGAGWAAINNGDNLDIINSYGEPVTVQYTDGDHLWGVWSGSIPELELSQTIKGLPAGTYTLTADIVVQNDWAGFNLTTQRLFANNYVTMFGAPEDYIQTTDDSLFQAWPKDIVAAAEIDAKNPDAEIKHLNYAGNYSYEDYGASGAPYTTTVKFGLAQKGAVTIGFRTNRQSAVTGNIEGQASLGWFKLDNFRLVYESAEVPAGADAEPEETAINATNAAQQTTVEFYSINGVRLAAPQKGINIVKMSNGTTSKVLVK